jgi:hypothetical protein
VPHLVVLGFLWIAFGVLSVVALVAILVTGRYPRSIFEFNLELDVLADVTAALGFSPETRFSGPLQASVPDATSARTSSPCSARP